MDVIDAIRGRRTVKEYAPEPVPDEELELLLETARWAPNHRLTEPWRFRVLGPEARAALKQAAGSGADKLDRAPTLVVASYRASPLPLHAAEDQQAAACAVYAILLAAHSRGWASYWRTPGVLRTNEGRDACGLPEEERVLGLIHLGRPARQLPPPPDRKPVSAYAVFLR